ncbi:MAG: hypothetical protein MUF83_10205 [Acidimicrobiales bacterium]|jgi:multisubunit Na+/H+ antiporter MnhB subunit|nr:hypothetical protein [Acidimicrobiales bacterium]
MRRSVILETVIRAELPVLLVVSLYLLFAGHNQPGGGFAGGLVAGAAYALALVAGGAGAVRRTTRFQPTTLLGAGLLLATLTALVPLFTGNDLLEHDVLSADLPVLGTVKTTTALFFDTGVYLVVTGLVLLVVTALGPGDLDVGDVDATPGDGT